MSKKSRFVLASCIESYLVIQALSAERIVDCKMKLLWPRTVLMSTAEIVGSRLLYLTIFMQDNTRHNLVIATCF